MPDVIDDETEERRFEILDCVPEGYSAWERCHVTTGFLEASEEKNVRVRAILYYDGRPPDYFKTTTVGRGHRRRKRSVDLPAAVAQDLLNDCEPRITYKHRYRRDNMRVDVFEKSLYGSQYIEFKGAGPDTLIECPDWIRSWREKTGRVTNYTLAELAAMRSRNWSDEVYRKPSPLEKIPFIVLTSGPAGGKTTAMKYLKSLFADWAGFVPEMASLIGAELGFKLGKGEDPLTNLEMQTTVARAQRVFEDGAARLAYRHGKSAIICDRGEVDGGAYMEGGVPTLEIVSGLPISVLRERYIQVIYLAVPPREVYDLVKPENPHRVEDHAQACAVGDATYKVWEGHPNIVVVGNYPTMEEKLKVIAGHVRATLDRIKAAA